MPLDRTDHRANYVPLLGRSRDDCVILAAPPPTLEYIGREREIVFVPSKCCVPSGLCRFQRAERVAKGRVSRLGKGKDERIAVHSAVGDVLEESIRRVGSIRLDRLMQVGHL